MVSRITEKKQKEIKIYENKKFISQVCRSIEEVIDDNPQILRMVSEDLSVGRKKGGNRGRPGLPAKSVLVLMIYKYFRGLSYEGLENEIDEVISL